MKESIMKQAISIACLLVGCLATSKALASDPVGIYALIDKVVLEPSEGNPQRAVVYGAFSTAVKGYGDQYTPPQRGYLYYQLPPQDADANVAKAEWRDLKKSAGTGQIVAFASRYKPTGRIRTGPAPSGTVAFDERRVAGLIDQLDDQQQSVRDDATMHLRRVGVAAEPQLRHALNQSKSAEVKTRVDKILGDLQPDAYPIGFGLVRVRADRAGDPLKSLRLFPSAASPEDDALLEPGKARLVAGNIADANSRYEYKFEIEGSDGQHESSSAIQQGEKQTEWRPNMEIKPGVKYTWRVWVETTAGRGPVAVSTFRAK
jgi:hypothetical protein